MTAIVSVFWRICLFRTGPDAVPSNNFFLGLLIVLNIFISWSVAMLLQAVVPIPAEITNEMDAQEISALSNAFLLFAQVLVTLASTGVLIWGLLNLMGQGARTNKVLCASFGCEAVLTALTLVAVYLGQTLLPVLGQFTMLATFLWSLAVQGFILHRGLEIRIGFGIAASFFIMIFSFAISQMTLNG